MREIIYKQPDINYHNEPCPNCGLKKLVNEPIPCPDNKEGCLVIHYGYRCYQCGKCFQD